MIAMVHTMIYTYTALLLALFVIVNLLVLGITLRAISSENIQKRDKQVISVTLIVGYTFFGFLFLYIFLFSPSYDSIHIVVYVAILGLITPIIYVLFRSIFGRR